MRTRAAIRLLTLILGFVTSYAAAQQPAPCVTCKEVTVMVFFGLDCPISQKYVPRLNELVSTYADFTWEFLVPVEPKKKELRGFEKEYQTKFSLIPDPGMERTMKYKVTVTPEIVVVKGANRVLYQGGIDNWFYELGKYRQFITEHYLSNALNAITKGETIVVPHTEAIGCIIQMPVHDHH